MEIRPMTEIQTAVARQEDVKRDQQRELKARESSKKRAEELLRKNQEHKDQSISSAQEIEDGHIIDPQVDVIHAPSLSLPQKQRSSGSSQGSTSYFKDPNLGGNIDISS